MPRGEYNSKGLRLVLDALKAAAGQHLSAEEITSGLRSRGERIGKTTVYRNLEKLLLRGEISCCQGEGGSVYCLCDNEHVHIVCSRCGKLTHLECKEVDSLASHISADHGFVLDKRKTVLYGICGECL